MSRFLTISSICLLLGACAANAQSSEPEEHLYSIKWAWGLMDLNAADAHVQTSCNDGEFFGTLIGQSIPWEGRIYSVADTLQASLQPGSESIKYVNGWYRKPKVKNPGDPEDPANYLTIQGQGQLDGSPKTMEAVAVTANMLSLYYYAKCIDFSKLSAGQEITIPVTGDGNVPSALRIIYNGPCDCGYSVTFCYDFDNVPENYEVQCHIDAATQLPVMFSSDIRIGHVCMTLVE